MLVPRKGAKSAPYRNFTMPAHFANATMQAYQSSWIQPVPCPGRAAAAAQVRIQVEQHAHQPQTAPLSHHICSYGLTSRSRTLSAPPERFSAAGCCLGVCRIRSSVASQDSSKLGPACASPNKHARDPFSTGSSHVAPTVAGRTRLCRA